VVTCDLPERMPEIEALAAEHGTVAVGADVAKPGDVDSLFEAAKGSGPLRGAVSCAGVLAKAYLSETTPEMFDHLVDVNLKGNFLVMRAAHQALRRQGRPGSVVVVSSINGLIGLPSQAVYSAAKAAVNSLVTAAAVEGGPYGIRVKCHSSRVDSYRWHEPQGPATTRPRASPSPCAGSANPRIWSVPSAFFSPTSQRT